MHHQSAAADDNNPRRAVNSRSTIRASLGKAWLTTYLIAIVVICALLVFHGPRLHAAIEAEKERAIAVEDDAFCSIFGVGPASGRFAECTRALKHIRTLHEQRSTASIL